MFNQEAGHNGYTTSKSLTVPSVAGFLLFNGCPWASSFTPIRIRSTNYQYTPLYKANRLL